VNLEKYIKMKFSGPKSGNTESSDLGQVVDPDTNVTMSANIQGDLQQHIRAIDFSAYGNDKNGVDTTASY